jgi:hypothetical protein
MGGDRPRAALELLDRRGAAAGLDAARTGVVMSWAARDFTAAQAWIEAQPASEARDQTAQRLAIMRLPDDPRAAEYLVERVITGDQARADARTAIAQFGSARDVVTRD